MLSHTILRRLDHTIGSVERWDVPEQSVLGKQDASTRWEGAAMLMQFLNGDWTQKIITHYE
eukprot:11770420-Prorocentrum_lima.AAC.1